MSDIDIDTTHSSYSHFYTHVWMYSVLYSFITYVGLCIHCDSQNTEKFHHHKEFL